jgi:hypothetical protein
MTQACNVCLVQHDEETHDATNRVHGWFRAKVTKYLHDPADAPTLSEVEEPAAPQLNAA